jgi:hypothetical protein
MPKGIIPNTIPFYKSETTKKKYPCFVLIPDTWNDWFKWITLFNLRFFKDEDLYHEIGFLKIMKD